MLDFFECAVGNWVIMSLSFFIPPKSEAHYPCGQLAGLWIKIFAGLKRARSFNHVLGQDDVHSQCLSPWWEYEWVPAKCEIDFTECWVISDGRNRSVMSSAVEPLRSYVDRFVPLFHRLQVPFEKVFLVIILGPIVYLNSLVFFVFFSFFQYHGFTGTLTDFSSTLVIC